MVEVAVDQRRAADLERRRTARARAERARCPRRLRARRCRSNRARGRRSSGTARRPAATAARDVDGDRDRLLLRQRREIVAGDARAPRAARAAPGRCAGAERRRRRPRARATRPRAATRRRRPRRPSARRRRRPARRTSTARARTARRARGPTRPRPPRRSTSVCARSGSSSMPRDDRGPRLRHPGPQPARVAGPGDGKRRECIVLEDDLAVGSAEDAHRVRTALRSVAVNTRSRPNQAPLRPSHRAGARAPAGGGAGGGRRARANRARAARRRRALGLGDGRAGVRRAPAAQGGAASRARRAAVRRADRSTGADRDAQDARRDAHRRRQIPSLAPQPGLQHLERLVAQVEEAGLPVTLRVEGRRPELPPGIDLSAYRIVQEGLTNALKHSRGGHAEVVVRYDDDSVSARDHRRRRRRERRRPAGTGSSGCASASRCTAARSTRDRATAAASSCAPSCRWRRAGDPHPARRRPGARSRGLPHDPRRRARHGGRRRGRRRPRGDRPGALAASRRRADGHPHAGARRARGRRGGSSPGTATRRRRS